MVKKKPQTLKELFQKANRQPKRSVTDDEEERELQKAIELSRKEQVNEQRRLLEQFSQLSQTTKPKPKPKPKLKRRLIQHISEDEDDDLQAVSSRPQIPKKQKKIKQEKTEEPLLEIADLSAFLNASDTEEEEEEELIVENLSEFLQEPSSSAILIDDDDDDDIEETPFANERLDWQREAEEGAAVISDSDCSVIDLVNPDSNNNSNDLLLEEEQQQQGDEDDGYLSPLEGFTNIKENRDNALFNPFFEQLQQKTTKRKRKTTTTTAKKKPSYRGKWYYVNKRKRKKN